jgi:hypothetical protein
MVNCISGQLSYGQLSFLANFFLIKRHLGDCLYGQMSLWAIVFLGKCLLGKCLSGQMSFWANVFLGKCPARQMSYHYFGVHKWKVLRAGGQDCRFRLIGCANTNIKKKPCQSCVCPALVCGPSWLVPRACRHSGGREGGRKSR